MHKSCDKLFQPGLVTKVTKLNIILVPLIKMIFDLPKASKLTKIFELLKAVKWLVSEYLYIQLWRSYKHSI